MKISIKQQIKEFLKEKEKATLQEIYKGLEKPEMSEGIKKHNIRAVLNISVKNNGQFERVGKGEYKLRDKTTTFSVDFSDLSDKEKNPKFSLSAKDILDNKKIPKRNLDDTKV